MSDANISKQVGWEPRAIDYPTMDEVKNSTPKQRLEWNRFLPSATNDEQVEIINEIFKRGW